MLGMRLAPRFRFRLVLLLALAVYLTSPLLSPLSSALDQAQRGFSAEDYLAFKFVSDPQISPDGKLVAYVQTLIDAAQNRRVSAIWMVPSDGSAAPAPFTTSPQSATSPRWSPHGQRL